MEDSKNQARALVPMNAALQAAQEKFVLAATQASQLKIVNNFGAAFTAVGVVKLLRDALTDEVMNEVFMPLMNTKIGFLTDRDPSKPDKKTGQPPTPYPVPVVRDCLIDALAMGLMPTGNQMNILAGRMYPTKEGYSALLSRLGVKYICEVGLDESEPTAKAARIQVVINYSYNGEKSKIATVATVKKDGYSSLDQLRGKAERRGKKILYEYLTGCDMGEDGETAFVDTTYTIVDEQNQRHADAQQQAATQQPIGHRPAQQQGQPAQQQQQPQGYTQQPPQNTQQPQEQQGQRPVRQPGF